MESETFAHLSKGVGMQKLLITLAAGLIIVGALLARAAIVTDYPWYPGSVAFLSSFLGFVAGYSAGVRHYRSRLGSDRQEDGGIPEASNSLSALTTQPGPEPGSCPGTAIRVRQDGEDVSIELEGNLVQNALWFAFFGAMNCPVMLILWVGVACVKVLNHQAVDWDQFLAGAAITIDILAAVLLVGIAIFTLPGSFARTVIVVGSSRLLVKRTGLLGLQTWTLSIANVRSPDVTMFGLVIRNKGGSDLPIPTGRTRAENEWIARELRKLLPVSAADGPTG
jgi:hypothetical protein